MRAYGATWLPACDDDEEIAQTGELVVAQQS
jgi:hypothetical protein